MEDVEDFWKPINEEEDDEDEDVLFGDGNETTLVRKNLLTPKVDSGEHC